MLLTVSINVTTRSISSVSKEFVQNSPFSFNLVGHPNFEDSNFLNLPVTENTPTLKFLKVLHIIMLMLNQKYN